MASSAVGLGSSIGANAASAGIASGIQLASSLIMGLLAAHDARVKAAKEENAAVGQAVMAMDSDLQTIFNAANAGEISAQTAQTLCGYIWGWYWQFIQPLQQGGIKGNHCSFPFPNPKSKPSGNDGTCYADSAAPCSGSDCTAGCCIGCGAIGPTLSRAIYTFASAGGATLSVCPIVGNKYGLQSRASYSLTYKPPAAPNATLQTVLNPATGQVTVGLPGANNTVVVSPGEIETSQGLVSGQPVGTVTGSSAPLSSSTKSLIFGAILAGIAAIGAGLALRKL